jgi:molybdopterin-guanine dinucleotide biosynthesis protein B
MCFISSGGKGMRVFSVFGISKSGKTTTIEEIIKELRRRRYTVGSVKEIHFESFAIDQEGTNTDRHKKAGSQLVTARGLYETDVLFQSRLPVSDLLRFYDHDFVVLEGVDDYNVPKIICAHSTEEIDQRLDPTVFAIAGVISKDMKKHGGLPVFNALTDIKELVDCVEEKVCHMLPNMDAKCCGECGASCEEMLADILKGKRQRGDCSLDKGRIKLYIGEREIDIVPFVQETLEKTIRGFVSALKGYESSKEIVIKIHPETNTSKWQCKE